MPTYLLEKRARAQFLGRLPEKNLRLLQRPDLVPHLQGRLFEKRTSQAVKSASKKIILADNGPRVSMHL